MKIIVVLGGRSMEKQSITQFVSKNNIKIRSLTNLIGISLLFVAGLVFVLFIDLKVKLVTQKEGASALPLSLWLFLSIIFALGGGIFYFIGDSMKHKKIPTLVLKGIGLLLTIGYIVFLFVFKNWVSSPNTIKADALSTVNTITIISLVITILGLISLIINYVLSILFIEEDY